MVTFLNSLSSYSQRMNDPTSSLGRKLKGKTAIKDAKKKATAINDKFSEAMIPDAIQDVERSARGEERRMQREIKTGRSSTILGMREDIGMGREAMANTRGLTRMEGSTNTKKLSAGKAQELATLKKTLLGQLDDVGQNVRIDALKKMGMDIKPEVAADLAKRKKRTDFKKSIRANGIGNIGNFL